MGGWKELGGARCVIGIAALAGVACDDAALTRVPDAAVRDAAASMDAHDPLDASEELDASDETDASDAALDASDATTTPDGAGDATDDARVPPPTDARVCAAEETRCDGIDDDCDGEIDEACPTPPAPLARFPWNGWRSGSVRSGAIALRPTFRWEPIGGIDEYRVALATDCDPASFRACTFDGATVHVVRGSTFVPSADLDARSEAPVGTRYTWRVRACVGPPPDDDVRCGPWSEPRYLWVGRTRSDVDGDGYADLIVGAPRHDVDGPANEGAIFVYAGSPSGVVEDGVEIANPDDDGGAARFGESVTSCDLDGDGYDDVIAGAFQHDEGATTDVGLVYVLHGGASGLDLARVTRHSRAGADAGEQLGADVTCADIDADGDDDVLAGGWSSGTRGLVATFVNAGDAAIDAVSDHVLRSPMSAIDDQLGQQVSARGDVDGDGVIDVAVGAAGESGTWEAAFTDGRGRVYVWRGGAPPEGAADWAIESTAEPSEDYGGELGRAVTMGDLDGDGFADVAVGAWRSFPGGAGCAFVHAGSRDGVALDPTGSFFGMTGDVAGSTLAAGDVDGDGAAELLVGGHESMMGRGRLWLFRGLAFDETWADVGAPGDRLGGTTTMLDVNGDGAQDFAVRQTDAVLVVLGSVRGSPTYSATLPYPGSVAVALFGRSLG